MTLPTKIQEHIKALLGNDKKILNLLIVLGVAGMILLAVSEWLPQKSSNISAPVEAAEPVKTAGSGYVSALESRLSALIAQVSGAGRVKVMVTLASGEDTVYAQDVETSADGSGKQQHVLLDTGSAPALVETVDAPSVQGVAVVCDGGEDIHVKAQITEIVKVLTDVGASRISVTKMSQSNE